MIVIADDFTGGAEIAGIGWRAGMTVRLHVISLNSPSVVVGESKSCVNTNHTTKDPTVFVTNTRSLSETEAKATIHRLLQELSLSSTSELFVKIDSAMRGHIIEETILIARELAVERILIIPQNPSKGRTITDGNYYINGVPIENTNFRHDPEYPILSSDVLNILHHGVNHSALQVKMLDIDEPLRNGVFVAEASTINDIKKQLAKADEQTLIVGAADCFQEYINCQLSIVNYQLSIIQSLFSDTIIVQGSTQSQQLKGIPALSDFSVYSITDMEETFMEQTIESYLRSKKLILNTGKKKSISQEQATLLCQSFADKATRVIRECKPRTIIVEGGATAFAIVTRLGWNQFTVHEELAAGIVALIQDTEKHFPTPILIVKPGSYPWFL